MLSDETKQRLVGKLNKAPKAVAANEAETLNDIIHATNEETIAQATAGSLNYPPIRTGEIIPDEMYWKQVVANGQTVAAINEVMKTEPSQIIYDNLERVDSITKELEVLMSPIEKDRLYKESLARAAEKVNEGDAEETAQEEVKNTVETVLKEDGESKAKGRSQASKGTKA